MCGISGYVGHNKFFPNKKKINSCLNLMKKRGPDSQKKKFFFFKKLNSLFCASRLSIIDIKDRSNQPIEDEKGILCFNGEIYNYIEIKKGLLKQKIKFKTTSDTEVLLKYLNFYGIEKINNLHGMWSFAYFSKVQNKIYICRDRFGEKPIFFSLNKKKRFLLFGSNINYIRKLSKFGFELDKKKLYEYLRYGFRSVFSNENTFFKGIKYIKQGTYLQIDENFNVKNKSYFIKNTFSPTKNNFSKVKKNLKKKISEVFKRSFRSDVPIAFLLSGGVDSSIISFFANQKLKNIKFYSIKHSEKNYDESFHINLLKKKFKLKHEYIPAGQINKSLVNTTKLIADIGFPLLSTTNLAISEICKKIKKDGYRILITGNGGDEIFSGYYAHHLSFLLSLKNSKIFKKKFHEWAKSTKPHIRTEILKNLNLFKNNLKRNSYNFETNIYDKYFKIKIKKDKKIINNYSKDLFINHLDRDLYDDMMPAQTHTIDNITMHHSIESRMPFLSHELYKMRNQFRKSFFISDGLAKYILRDTFKNNIPREIALNTEKTGFFLPLSNALDYKNKKNFNIIEKNKFLKRIINIKFLKEKIEKNKLNQQDQKFIFLLYNAAIFLKVYS